MKLKVHDDERGWLIEAFKEEFPEGQVYAFSINPGKTRGKHYHKRKKEWFCILEGGGTLVVGNERHTVSKHDKIYIPPNQYHELANTGKTLMIAIAFSNEKYDPEDPDTYRVEGPPEG